MGGCRESTINRGDAGYRAGAERHLGVMLSRMLRCALLGLSLAGLAVGRVADQSTRNDEVKVEMRDVMYHFSSAIGVHIAEMQGRLRPTREGSVPLFDDAGSFVIAMDYAEIGMSTDSLSAVLNQHVFAAAD